MQNTPDDIQTAVAAEPIESSHLFFFSWVKVFLSSGYFISNELKEAISCHSPTQCEQRTLAAMCSVPPCWTRHADHLPKQHNASSNRKSKRSFVWRVLHDKFQDS